MTIMFALCTTAGLVVVANVADRGPMYDVNGFVLVIPFISGPIFFLSTLVQWCLRVSWQKRTDWELIRKEKDLRQRIAEEMPSELQMTTAEMRRFYHPLEPWSAHRTKDGKRRAQVEEIQQLLATVHPDGTVSRGFMSCRAIHTDRPKHRRTYGHLPCALPCADDAIHITTADLSFDQEVQGGLLNQLYNHRDCQFVGHPVFIWGEETFIHLAITGANGNCCGLSNHDGRKIRTISCIHALRSSCIRDHFDIDILFCCLLQ